MGCASAGGFQLKIGPETAETVLLPGPPASPRAKYLYSVKAMPERERRGATGSDLPFFRGPIAVAEVRKSLFYFVDQPDSLLLRLEPASGRWRFIEPIAKEPLLSLVGLAADDAGGIYLTDSALKGVFKLREDGRLERFAEDHPFGRPTGIAFDAKNRRLWVVDTLESTVSAFDLSGKKILELGRRGDQAGELNHPTFIACDRQGALYVSDTLNFRVQCFAADGSFRFSFGSLGDGPGAFAAPKGIAIASDGRVYVVDGRLDRVQAFSATGDYLFAFGSSGTGPGQLWSPNGIAVDETGKVYVCDFLNDRVQVFQLLGEP